MNPEPQTDSHTTLPKLILGWFHTSEVHCAYGRAKKSGDITSATLLKWELDKRDIPPPELKKVPMTAEDFPPVFWVRHEEAWHLVTHIGKDYIMFGTHNFSFVKKLTDLLMQGFVYSTDRKEAKGCWKYE